MLYLLSTVAFLASRLALGSLQPNIILMVVDDLGFNHVPWHNTVHSR